MKVRNNLINFSFRFAASKEVQVNGRLKRNHVWIYLVEHGKIPSRGPEVHHRAHDVGYLPQRKTRGATDETIKISV